MRWSRNVLVGIGAYCASRWLDAAIAAGFGVVARRVWPDDYVADSLLRSLRSSAPDAVAAALCGLVVALVVESPHPARWTAVPAMLLLLVSLEEALASSWTWSGYVTQTLIGALPAVVCVAAGQIGARHRALR